MVNTFLGGLIASLSKELGREVAPSEFRDVADLVLDQKRGRIYRWTPQKGDIPVCGPDFDRFFFKDLYQQY
jgi:hypothetical protein